MTSRRHKPSEIGNARQRQFRVPPMILRVFASKSSQIELRQPERGEGVLILCACRQPQQRICTLMFEHACGKRSVPLVWLISAMGLFRATFPTDFGPKIRKKYDFSCLLSRGRHRITNRTIVRSFAAPPLTSCLKISVPTDIRRRKWSLVPSW